MNFLTEHGITQYEQLENKVAETIATQDKLLATIKSIERWSSDLVLLIKHTANYRELKPLYDRYKKSNDKEKFLRGQEGKIILFEASAKSLKQMGVERLPNIAELKKELATVQATKEALYTDYLKIKSEAKEMDTLPIYIKSDSI